MSRTLHTSKSIFKTNKLSVASFIVIFIAFLLISNVVRAQVIMETFEDAPWSTMAPSGTTSTNGSFTSSSSLTSSGLQTITSTTSTNGATTTETFNSFNEIVVTVAATAANQTITSQTGNASTQTVTLTTNAPASTGTWTWYVWGGGAAVVKNYNYNAGGGATTPHSDKIAVRLQGGYLATPIITTGISQITFWTYANSSFYVGLKTVFTGNYVTNTSSFPNSAMPTSTSVGTITLAGNIGQQFGNNMSTYNTSNSSASAGNLHQVTYTVPTSMSSLPLQLAFWGGANGVSIDDIVITSGVGGPTVTTDSATSITTTTATINGNVNANSLSGVTGTFDWGLTTSYSTTGAAATPSSIPTTPATNDSLLLSGLTPNTLYNYRADAVLGGVTTNGANATFATAPNPPTALTATTATSTGFTVGWTAPAIGGTSYTYTVIAATNSTFTTGVVTFSGIAQGTTSKVLTGLSSSTVYYYEVEVVSTLTGAETSTWATSIASANPTTITTLAPPPVATTTAATAINTTGATLNGTVNAEGNIGVTTTFDYGTTTGYGTNVAGSPAGVTGSSATSVSYTIASGLVSNTLYHFRINAVLGGVITNGADATFVTIPNAPTTITANTATTSGFTVSWTAPINTGAGYTYTVIASTSNTFATGNTTVTGIASSTTSYTFTSLSSGTTYYYEVETVSTLTGLQTSAFNQSTTVNNPTSITTLNNPVGASTVCTTGTGSSGSPAVIPDGTPASYTDALWANAPTNPINQTTVAGGTIETGSTWQAMFDANNLYVLIKLNDLNNNSSCSQGGNSYNYDGVDVLLDGDNSHNTFGGGISGQNTYNRSCSGTNTTPTAGGGTESNSTYSTVVNGASAYTQYITIPWANVPSAQHLMAGQITALSTIGFDVDYNDDQTVTGTGTTRTNQQAWYTNNSGLYNTPSLWGYAALSVCAPPTLSVPVLSNITATSATLQDTVKALNGGGSMLASTSGNNAAGVQYSVNSGLVAPAFATLVGTPSIGSPFSVSSGALSPQTKYYYQGYATRTNFSTNVIGTSTINNFYTLSALPTTQPTTFTIGCPQTLSWSAVTGLPSASQATRVGYVILRKSGSAAPAITTNINRYPPNSAGFKANLPAGTILADSISYVNASLPTGTLTFTDTAVVGTYSYVLVPFTFDGTPGDSTYNYFITGAQTITNFSVSTSITWLGTDQNWNNTANWCNGSIPTATTNVTIPNGVANYPVLSTAGLSATGYVDSISLGTTASLTIGTGGSLSIHGAITNSGGTFNATAGTIVMAGNAAQSITGANFVNQTIYSLMDSTTFGGLSVDSISIIGELGFPYSGTSSLSISNSLVLVSDTATTAWVGPITEVSGVPQATITGKVIVQRYFPSHRRWRLVTGPVTAASAPTINASWQEGVVSVTGVSNPNPVPGYGTHITGPVGGAYQPGLGYDQSPTNNPSIGYIKDTAAWYTIPNTNVTKVTDHQGYMLFVRGSRNYNIATTTQYTLATPATLRTTGSLNTGVQNIPVVAGPNVIGNPYASTINFNTIFSHATTQSALGSSTANNTFYLWDPDIASTANTASGTGGWVVLTSDGSGINYIPVPDPRSISPFDVNGNIQSGAAFMVHAQGSGDVEIDESDKVSPASTNNDLYLFRPVAVPVTMLRTTLYVTAADTISYLSDGVLNMFDSSYSNDVNFNEDIQKQANLNEQCSIIKSGRLLAVERSLPVNVGDTIYLQLVHLNQLSYRFVFEATDFNRPDLNAYLIDTFMHTTTPVSLGDSVTSINFSVTSVSGSAAANRFAITFRPAPGSVTYTNVTATTQNKNVLVQWTVNNQLNIQEYVVEKSTDGVNFYPVDTTLATSVSSASYSWVDTAAIIGTNYYKIRNIDNNGMFQESNTVKVIISNSSGGVAASGMVISPNPVINGAIGLQMNNMPIGEYGIKVIDASGQVLLVETINHSTASETRNIFLNNGTAKGVYILEVQLPDNSRTKIKFVNQ
jgi:hypothetical protein